VEKESNPRTIPVGRSSRLSGSSYWTSPLERGCAVLHDRAGRIYADGNCTSESYREADALVADVNKYLKTEGKHLKDYMARQGLRMEAPDAMGAMSLEDQVIAAVLKYDTPIGRRGILISNSPGYEQRVRNFGDQYMAQIEDLAERYELAKEFVLEHELFHQAGITGEIATQRQQELFYRQRARQTKGKEKQRYEAKARAAAQRIEEEISKN